MVRPYFAGCEIMTQSWLAGNLPRSLTLKNAKKCFISALLYCSCLLFRILQIIFVGCPWLASYKDILLARWGNIACRAKRISA